MLKTRCSYAPYTPVVLAILNELHQAGYSDWQYAKCDPDEVYGDVRGFTLRSTSEAYPGYWFNFECLDSMQQISLFNGVNILFSSTCNFESLKAAVRVFVACVEGSNNG